MLPPERPRFGVGLGFTSRDFHYIITLLFVNPKLTVTKIRLPKGIKKYIRKEKARIRREIFDISEQEQKIQELLNKFYAYKKGEINSRAG